MNGLSGWKCYQEILLRRSRKKPHGIRLETTIQVDINIFIFVDFEAVINLLNL